LLDARPISVDERALLFSGPSFELLFPRDGVGDLVETRRVDELDRSSLERITLRIDSESMLAEATFEIVGDADVIRTVGALQHIDVVIVHVRPLRANEVIASLLRPSRRASRSSG